MVLSPRSLSYARFALESLLRNCAEPIHLQLITDSAHDKALLSEEMAERQQPGPHSWTVYAEDDLADREADLFGAYPKLRHFRRGHPCWRKITDPVLLTAAGEEMVLLDPDLYFPNRFRFEATPDDGVLLMWQRPNCLFPPETVQLAMRQGIPLAHHVDIGVGGWRAPVDMDWMEWLLVKLGCPDLPRLMHIEAIVWAALAMRIGGGYLDPDQWHCWHRSQANRVRQKLGAPGLSVLRSENFAAMKCFHAGGQAKYWLPDVKSAGLLDTDVDRTSSGMIQPFVELSPKQYQRELSMKSLLRKMGYYRIFQSA